ncbi:pseudaminic acid synthase [Hahella sp. CCB-MM4]|uniref:pseudaminic acid synthase n=1 Tax=Hahella sp. (strain CCB-MM4) TaxID=1926491 RepID=UPI000B9B52CF|nr:pseudaminic acid synthase [Hahella sp. CCB-MM4]OZG73779.1 pseudaminic acid synthase [Hahella sp. CCB-MM4]
MAFKNTVTINGRTLGNGHPPYIIAELSANHNGSLERALSIIDMAHRCGADAIKLQTYKADTITFDSDKEDFQIHGGLWDGKTLYELYEWAHMPWDWHKPLFEHARKLGITIFSSPFDDTAVDLLEDLGAPAYKIASFEAIDLPLIRYTASTGKPLIISTGMATEDEIQEAAAAAADAGCQELVLLHCVSGYPAPAEDYNLRTLTDMMDRYNCLVGLSDHTIDNAAAIASVALGACLIEKHVTLDRKGGGPDDSFSLEPDDLKMLCESSRTAWQALGSVDYSRKASEVGNAKFRRSLYAVKNIRKGEPFTLENVRSIRPGFGLAPKHREEILGKSAAHDIEAGTALNWDLIEH